MNSTATVVTSFNFPVTTFTPTFGKQMPPLTLGVTAVSRRRYDAKPCQAPVERFNRVPKVGHTDGSSFQLTRQLKSMVHFPSLPTRTAVVNVQVKAVGRVSSKIITAPSLYVEKEEIPVKPVSIFNIDRMMGERPLTVCNGKPVEPVS